jgi:hypothetical protein
MTVTISIAIALYFKKISLISEFVSAKNMQDVTDIVLNSKGI